MCHLTSAYSSKDSHVRNTNTADCSNKPDAGRDKVKKGGEEPEEMLSVVCLASQSPQDGWQTTWREGGKSGGFWLTKREGAPPSEPFHFGNPPRRSASHKPTNNGSRCLIAEGAKWLPQQKAMELDFGPSQSQSQSHLCTPLARCSDRPYLSQQLQIFTIPD